MEQFRQIGEVLGSMNALMVLQDDNQINKRQCCLLFDMFKLAFDTLSEEIKQHLKLEEKNTKWKPLEQPLKELYRVFKEGEMYIKQCMDSRDWWVKIIIFHNNHDCVEFHIHNLLSHFPTVIEAIETAGEISGLDLDDMMKKRVMLANKYDKTWNDPKLFQWKYGKQYLISREICLRLSTVWKEDQWLLLEKIKEKKKSSPLCPLTKQEQRLGDLLMKKLNGSGSGLELEFGSLFPSGTLTGAKDYQVRRRLGGGSQYKEIQWLGESFALRHFFGEPSSLNPEISTLLSLSHPNVIQYLCGFHDEEKKEYFLVMELMSKDLNSYIKEACNLKRRLPFSFPSAIDIMLQIARGMEYLHSKNIYHGDLNPLNVLIKPRISSSSEGYFIAKVSGFGLRSVKTVPSRLGSSPNTQNETLPFIWLAPEVLAEQERPGSNCKHKYSEKADVYSFGMLCFEILTGKVPFEDGHLQGDKMSRNIRAGERPLFPFVLPKYLATMTKRCWQTDPNQRPSFSSLCRILRFIKRLIVVNPHLADPEIPSVVQTDFCDIELGFLNKFQLADASAVEDLSHVSEIPFQLFSYRLAEKEKLSGGFSRDKNWDSHSEVVRTSHVDDTRSVCSDNSNKKHPIFKKANGIINGNNEQFLPMNETMAVCFEIPEKKALPPLRKSKSINAAAGHSPLLTTPRDGGGRSACPEIPEKKPLVRLKKSTTLSSFQLADAKSLCGDIPEKKVPDKKFSLLRKSNSVRVSKDSGKHKGQTKGPSVLNARGHSTRISADKQPSPLHRSFRCKHKQDSHSIDSDETH